ncbi:MAG: hypothetical protein AB8G11_06580 [Saprospiraceae bacterium]
MIDRNDKMVKSIEVSAGLVVGYLLAAGINWYFFDKDLNDAFLDERIIFGIAGVGTAVFLYIWQKRKTENQSDD